MEYDDETFLILLNSVIDDGHRNTKWIKLVIAVQNHRAIGEIVVRKNRCYRNIIMMIVCMCVYACVCVCVCDVCQYDVCVCACACV